ncbi:MAG: hypothetical protein RR435_01835 [Erysipelotrichaceae bacterium]
MAVTVMFIFFSAMFNPNINIPTQVDGLVTSNGTFEGTVATSFSSILAFLVIFLCIMCVFFANSFYLLGKSKYLGLMILSGTSVIKRALFLFVQNTVLLFIAIPTGLVVGYIGTIIMNAILYSLMGINASIFTIFPECLMYTAVVIFLVIVWLMIIDAGFSYRMEINHLLSLSKSAIVPKYKMFSISAIFYEILCVVPIVAFIALEPNAFMYISLIGIVAVGISGFIKDGLPALLMQLQKMKFESKKIELIALGNVRYSISKCSTLIQILLVAIVGLIAFLSTSYNDIFNFTMVLITMVITIIMLCMCITYKVLMEAGSRKISFLGLYNIGYSIEQIKEIVKKEMILFYSLLCGVPLIYSTIILVKSFSLNYIDLIWVVIILAIILFIFICFGMANYKMYSKVVIPTKVVVEGDE